MDILVGKVTKQFRSLVMGDDGKYPNYCKICEEVPLSV